MKQYVPADENTTEFKQVSSIVNARCDHHQRLSPYLCDLSLCVRAFPFWVSVCLFSDSESLPAYNAAPHTVDVIVIYLYFAPRVVLVHMYVFECVAAKNGCIISIIYVCIYHMTSRKKTPDTPSKDGQCCAVCYFSLTSRSIFFMHVFDEICMGCALVAFFFHWHIISYFLLHSQKVCSQMSIQIHARTSSIWGIWLWQIRHDVEIWKTFLHVLSMYIYIYKESVPLFLFVCIFSCVALPRMVLMVQKCSVLFQWQFFISYLWHWHLPFLSVSQWFRMQGLLYLFLIYSFFTASTGRARLQRLSTKCNSFLHPLSNDWQDLESYFDLQNNWRQRNTFKGL